MRHAEFARVAVRPRRPSGRAALCMLLACLAVASGLAASPAQAMELTLQDDAHVLYRGDAEVRETLTRIRALGVDRVRLTASWSIIAPQPGSLERPDFDASDPAAYPQANW